MCLLLEVGRKVYARKGNEIMVQLCTQRLPSNLYFENKIWKYIVFQFFNLYQSAFLNSKIDAVRPSPIKIKCYSIF